MAGKKLISVQEAAGRLGVDPKTIRAWVRAGRLKGSIRQVQIVRDEILVDPSSLNGAFTVKCLYCGDRFESPHPERARFCSRRHMDLWNRERLLARPKPPPKGC